MQTSKTTLKSIVAFTLAALPFAAKSEAFEPFGDVTKITVVGVREKMPAAGTLPGNSIARRRAASSDSASLLDDVAGVSLYGAGGVSSLPVIHGMNDERVRVEVDGMSMTSACGNHMNPPLSYIDPSRIAKVSVYAGIAPVSEGGDSIGGTISVQSAEPEFAAPGERLTSGSIGSFYRSNGDGYGANLSATAANEHFSARIDSSAAQSGNYRDGNGNIVKSTRYAAQNTALTLAGRSGDALVVLDAGVQFIPHEAYPNARMDTTENQSYHFNLRYKDKFSWGALEARAYSSHTLHEMDMLEDKGGAMPMNTDGRNQGYSIKANLPLSDDDVLRIGNEFHRFRLDDWWPPVAGSMMMGPNPYANINDGRRDRLGAFAEWEHQWRPEWKSALGVRYDRVAMDTGAVQPYAWSGMMNAPDAAAAKAFNALDHFRADNNFDITALLRYSTSEASSYEAGYARKTRSPNLYERFAWGKGRMAMLMTGWFGDANGYVGNPDLKPEVAHTLSATAQWRGHSEKPWSLRVTPYVSYVENYIDVARCALAAGACTNANLTEQANFVFLQFVNHDARLYGVDMTGEFPLADTRYGGLRLKGIAAYVHGKDASTNDALYNIMPLNAKLTLEHTLADWSSVVELQLVAGKHDVQTVRNETATSGYGLLNLRTRYEWQNLSLDAGIENALGKYYEPPLGGAYVGTKPAVWGQNVAGRGRSLYVALGMQF